LCKTNGKTKKEREAYWEGFEQGKKNSLCHNILLMKSQLKAQKGKPLVAKAFDDRE